MNKKIQALRGELIVSCQALPEEPLHSSYIMSKMAAAALEGGAKGIRANTKGDIRAIQEEVDLPIIGIVKRDYPDCEVYITPTMKEVDELMEVKPEIIALDATGALRPGGLTLKDFVGQIREKYPKQLLMADCSTVKEAQYADEIGFDFIGTTMVGYTKQSQGDRIEEEDFRIIREILETGDRRREYQYSGKSKAGKRIGSLQHSSRFCDYTATADNQIICGCAA